MNGNALYAHNVLVVDDDPRFSALVKLQIPELLPGVSVTYAASREEALHHLRQKLFHFASIDQNIPRVDGEAVSADVGLQLCIDMASTSPLVMKSIYTAFGKTRYAQMAGSLDGTAYFEKSSGGEDEHSLTIHEYFGRVVREALDDYLLWALEKSRNFLPPAFGTVAFVLVTELRRRNEGMESFATIGDNISWLWEKGVWLHWAFACGMANAVGNAAELGAATPIDRSDYSIPMVRRIWARLGESGWFGRWRKYVSLPPQKGVPHEFGRAFADASEILRRFRNDVAHHKGGIGERLNFDAIKPALIAWVDALAFWADHPLIWRPRLHPSDRELIQFERIGGPTPWATVSVESAATLPKTANSRQHIFTLQKGPAGEALLSLFPFVTMVDRPGATPEPCFLMPSRTGFRRVSLVDGSELAIPLSVEEKAVLSQLFRSNGRSAS